jgi:hypothetical protein
MVARWLASFSNVARREGVPLENRIYVVTCGFSGHQDGAKVVRADRHRLAYRIVVPPRSLIVKPSSACLSATSMSS